MSKGADHELSPFFFFSQKKKKKKKKPPFVASSSVDLVRKRAADLPHVPPLDPLKALIDDFLRRGGVIWACTPCVKARGYTQEDFIDGVKIQGASAMHERLMAGASSLSF